MDSGGRSSLRKLQKWIADLLRMDFCSTVLTLVIVERRRRELKHPLLIKDALSSPPHQSVSYPSRDLYNRSCGFTLVRQHFVVHGTHFFSTGAFLLIHTDYAKNKRPSLLWLRVFFPFSSTAEFFRQGTLDYFCFGCPLVLVGSLPIRPFPHFVVCDSTSEQRI